MTNPGTHTIDAQGNLHDGGGRFAEKHNSAPAAGLGADHLAAWRSSPTAADIRLERWNARDEAETLNVVTLDVAKVLDGRSVAEIERARANNDFDWVLEDLTALGGIQHDGPFTVEFGEDEDGRDVLERYLTERRQLGRVAPSAEFARLVAARERRETEGHVERTAEAAGLQVMAPVLTVVMDREEVQDSTFRELDADKITDLYDTLCTRGLDAVEHELIDLQERASR